MDIDEDRLEGVYNLCRRYSEELGSRLSVEKTMDRREAMVGADFVINTALVCGLDRVMEGWQVAFRHGYRFGGSLHIVHDESFWVNFHQLRLMEDIARDIEHYCPDAWYLLVANPVLAGVTHLTREFPQIKTVGLCHGFSGVYQVADTLGLDREGLEFEIPGVNHFVWLTQFRHQGQDAYPLVDKWIEEESEEHFASCRFSSAMGPKAIDLYRRFGVLPIGDTGNPGGGSWGYWYHSDTAVERLWNEDPWTWYVEMIGAGNRRVEEINRIAADESVPVSEVFGTERSHETMVPLVECLSGNDEREMVVNVQNTGRWVEGVPDDFEVEVPAMVDATGVHPRETRALPTELQLYMQRDRIVPVETELLAYKSGSRNLLIDLVLMDPWTRNASQAEAFVDEILQAPFNDDMREHYR